MTTADQLQAFLFRSAAVNDRVDEMETVKSRDVV